MNYKIVIPSYQRAKSIKEKTLRMLKLHNIQKEIIHIFVASEEEKVEYEKENPEYKIIVGVLGITHQRNFIQKYFPVGTLLLSLDDDVESVSILHEDKLKPIVDLGNIIYQGFSECFKHNARLWGIYPVHNAFFMSHTISKDLKFCIGSFYGIINPGEELLNPSLDGGKEDYWRSILFWLADKAVIRINYVAHKTKMIKNPGGMQTQGLQARIEKETAATNKLLELYPDLVRLNPKRKSPFPEIILKRGR